MIWRLKRIFPVVWRVKLVFMDIWHMVWKQRIVTLHFPWPTPPVGPMNPPAVFWPVVGLLLLCFPVGPGRQYLTPAYSWISVSKNIVPSCFAFLNLFFFIGILNFNILFVLTHHLDSLVIYQVALTEHLCTDLTSIKCLCDSSKT